MARAGSSPYEAKQRRKQGYLASLAKLDDRDTQGAAVAELQTALKSLDAYSLPLFISCVSSSNDTQKVSARKESVRLLGQLASEACPVSQEALSQPHIGKIIPCVRSKFKDPDSSVRDAASDAIAGILGGLAVHSAKPLDQDHPLVRSLVEALQDASKEVQATAADALRKGAACLHCTPGLARAVVKALSSKGCLAPGAILGALASVAPGDESGPTAIQGLVKHAPETVVPCTASIVGSAAAGKLPATGTFCHVQSREWTVRKAACEAIYALAVQLGPSLDYGSAALLPAGDAGRISSRAGAALDQCRSDRIAEVRRWAVAGLAVLQDLQDFVGSGRDPSEWCWSEPREGVAKEREAKKPSGLASGSVKERFMRKSTLAAAGEDIDVVVKAPSTARPGSAPPGPPRNPAPAPAAPAVSQSVDAAQGSAPWGPPPAMQHQQQHAGEGRGRGPEYSSIPEEDEGQVGPPWHPEGFAGAPMQQAPEVWAAPMGSPPVQHHEAQQMLPPPLQSPPSWEGAQNQMATAHPEQLVPVPASEWAAVMKRLATMEAQQERMLTMVENFALNTQHAFQAVESRVAALETALDDLARSRERPRLNEDSSFYNATFAPDVASPDASALSPTGAEADFCSALKEGVKETIELMGKRGPQWSSVSSATALDLLAAARQAVQDQIPGALPAVLPWLWQLADQDLVSVPVTRQLAAAMIAALRSLPPSEASEGRNNVQLLISALEWTWGSLLQQQQQAEEKKRAAQAGNSQVPRGDGAAPRVAPIATSAVARASASPSRIPRSPRGARPSSSPGPGGPGLSQGKMPPNLNLQQPQRLRPPSPSMLSAAVPRPSSPLPAQAPSPSSASSRRSRPSHGEGLNAMHAQLDAMQAELFNSPRVRGT